MCTLECISWSIFGTGLILIIISIVAGYKIYRTKQYYTYMNYTNVKVGNERNDYGKRNSSSTESLFQSITYYKDFQILRERIQIDMNSVLGIGQFGSVYSATLSDFRREVAVKLPNHFSCSRDALVTIIKEIKLLCYIGNHDNLVKFLGYSYFFG